jgi:pilus assembly protein CpaE
MEDAGLIREEHLQRVIGLLRASYTHLILDLSKGFGSTDVTALRMADVILLVTQLELTSLRNTVRILLTLGADPALGDKVKVVLNRVGSDADIGLKKAEETIGKTIFWQVPNDARSMIESRNAGVPLVQHAPRSKVQLAIAGLAQALTGKTESAAAPAKKGRFFSFK